MFSCFISDLHLDPRHPQMIEKFFFLLNTEFNKADKLYILGDFFHLWIGDDALALNPPYQKILEALKRFHLQFKIPIYFMHGNHDFLITPELLQQYDCHYLSDPVNVHLYGTKVLLTHGDTLCINDIAYQQFRKQIRDPLFQQSFLSKPIPERLQFVAKIIEESENYLKQADEDILDAPMDEIKRIMREKHVLNLIHGHTHRPSIEYFNLDGNLGCRLVLSDWHERPNALFWYENGEKELRYF